MRGDADNRTLAEMLRSRDSRCDVRRNDFPTLGEELGEFDRVVMNPPSGRVSDLDQTKYAYQMLKPGGLLVATCANGPRQQEGMGAICSTWIDLPAGSFKGREPTSTPPSP